MKEKIRREKRVLEQKKEEKIEHSYLESTTWYLMPSKCLHIFISTSRMHNNSMLSIEHKLNWLQIAKEEEKNCRKSQDEMNINGHEDLMMLQACRFLYEHTGHGSEYLREIM